MIAANPYTLSVTTGFDKNILSKNCWIVILHASRIPPHVGIIINGSYSSLTIKGHELNISVDILLKTISQKKIETVAIQMVKQPVFSLDYQKEVFEYYINRYARVGVDDATCLSPVKLFLQEFYAIAYHKNELLFEITEHLKQNSYIYNTVGFNMGDTPEIEFSLPMYTPKQLQDVIDKETAHYTS